MANLPEQAHQRGTSVATIPQDDPYALDQSMVTLPRLRIAQYQSQAFKSRKAGYGDLVVGIGKDDAAPTIVAKGGEPLGEPLRFYVHRIQRGFNYAEDPSDVKRLTFGPLGGSYAAALAEAGGDPRRVFQKFDYTLTIPDYPLLPVRFLMTSRWGGNAARWMNTQIGMLRQQGIHPLTVAFQVQTRPTHNDAGDFAEAVLGIADVKRTQAAKDQEIVQRHAELLSSANIADDYEPEEAAVPDGSDSAPSLS